MDCLTTIALGLFASVAFYFIELKIIRKIFIANVKGNRKLEDLERDGEKIYYLSFYNESKVESFNVNAFVEFLNEKGEAVGYNEQRTFPYVRGKQDNVLYPLFSPISRNIPKEKRKENIMRVLENSKTIHVVITCQNQYGKIKKTDDFTMKIRDEKVVSFLDYQT